MRQNSQPCAQGGRGSEQDVQGSYQRAANSLCKCQCHAMHCTHIALHTHCTVLALRPLFITHPTHPRPGPSSAKAPKAAATPGVSINSMNGP